jgi:subtilisin family serine protease
VTGNGVGVAVIDTGVIAWHDDLSSSTGGSRVVGFVDFVGSSGTPYDDNGHGTHIAGIFAGSGADSGGARAGIAPGAHLLILKVLNASGQGNISNLIAALDYVVTHRTALNIRVVNLSIATSVSESYNTDPLARATKAAVDHGIVVVAAAGNRGRSSQGHTQYGGIGAPGNAPWVLTVGASSHLGTIPRGDDQVAPFSSRGPTTTDRTAKPDLVAPGVGIESLSVPDSSLYNSRSGFLLNGTVPTPYPPYLALSGTSQAAPVVAATVALMLEANPALTPNAVKAILQFTAERRYEYDNITQGAGFLNARGAVELARYFASPTLPEPSSEGWSKHLIWGNYRISALGARLTSDANAWRGDVVWGATATPTGEYVAWGLMCGAHCDPEPVWEPWAISCADTGCTSLRYGGGPARNIVWGSTCGGADCPPSRTWTASESETVVWGTQDSETVVWGTQESETVVWGTQDSETVVWGTNCNDPSCNTLWESEDP